VANLVRVQRPGRLLLQGTSLQWPAQQLRRVRQMQPDYSRNKTMEMTVPWGSPASPQKITPSIPDWVLPYQYVHQNGPDADMQSALTLQQAQKAGARGL
jgi:hypothetical protein